MLLESLESRVLLTVPTASNLNVEYLTRQALNVDFSVDVRERLTHDDLQVFNISTITGSPIGPEDLVPADNIVLSYPGGNGATASFSFQNLTYPYGILPNGNYRGTLSREDVANNRDEIAADVIWDNAIAAQNFFVLGGDTNRDRQVDVTDLGNLATNWQQPGDYSKGDFNYDGVVDVTDLGILATNWQALLYEAPQGPNVLQVNNLGSSRSLQLSWDANSAPPGTTAWRIQRLGDGSTFNLYADVPVDQVSTGIFVDDGDADPNPTTGPGLPEGTRFFYRIRPLAGTTQTAYTPKRGGTTQLPSPTSPSAMAISSTQVKVTWTDASQNETEFRIYRRPVGSGQFVQIGTVPTGNPNQYIDFGLSPGTTYEYYVTAKNQWIESAPVSFPTATTELATASVDLDLFEDVDGNGVHDNSAGAEQAEGNQPTELPYMEEDGDYEELALVVSGAASGATVTFNYSQTEIQLYRDVMGLTPINPGQTVNLADLGISGSGSISLFAKLTAGEQLASGAVTSQLGGGSTGTNVGLAGGTTRVPGGSGRVDNQVWHDDQPDPGSNIDNNGGLDDGDGPQGDLLTDRDGFWTRNAGKHTLIIGFSGHTQSLGTHGTNGQIWQIPNVGARQIGQQIYEAFNANWAITMFPEDPGNDIFSGISRCGDGVIGRGNPFHGNQRVDALGNPTGALPFLIDAIMNHGVTRIGLFGYSHGAGSVRLLIQTLARRAALDSNLLNRLIFQDVRFFWTAYIDAIHIQLDDYGGGQFETTGTPFAEGGFPIDVIPGSGFGLSIGTLWQYNAYQDPAIPFFQRDGVPLGGTELDVDTWADYWGRDRNFIRQDYAEPGNPVGLWPNGTDHTTRIDRHGRIRGHGIAEDTSVQALLINSLYQALFDTF